MYTRKLSPTENAKGLRYKRAALALVQREHICDELYEIQGKCSDMYWLIEGDENEELASALDGDTDDLHEFRFSFSDLEAKCESLHDALCDTHITEYFDDFLVGVLGKSYEMVGFDTFQEDYYSLVELEPAFAEKEAGKRLSRLTKNELLAAAGQCMGIFWAFLDIRHSFDCLKSAFDVLKEDREELMAIAKSIEDRYEQLQGDLYNYEFRSKFDSALSLLPAWIWVQ
ncbi:MAG: hypothetical protein FWB91_02120 [Defluviitaleaceae bacterium]|nr:hypothetical protein [Defluviitaleaceae bacterium]